jgi:endoglucanase
MRFLLILTLTSLLFSRCQPADTELTEHTQHARLTSTGTLLAQYPGGIPALTKGINLSGWFGSGNPASGFGTRFTAASLATVRATGFRHVRIPIGPNHFFQENTPETLNPANLPALVQGVNAAIGAGLAVVLDPIHASGDSDFERKLATDPAFLPKAQAYWRAMANQFKTIPNTQIFFEVMNEPHMADAQGSQAWYLPVQDSLIAAIRSVAPSHIILATAPDWGSMDALLNVTPTDKNVIWNFHYYSPMVFTHQGATWITPAFTFIKNLPYPSTPENVKKIANGISDPTAKGYVTYYGSERWNLTKVQNDLARIRNWANTHGVLTTCNEFGVYKAVAPATSRRDYIRDVRTTLEGYGVGWAMWEYDEGFGLVTYRNATTRTGATVDNNIKTALGL